MKRILVAVLGAIVLAGTSVVWAHHGYATFFKPTDRTVAIEGDLENLLYANPHVVMEIRAADSTIYTVTWQASRWVERNAGVTRTTFKVGDHLIITAAPSRDPASHEVTQVREVRRPRDGWMWRSTTPFRPPSA
jgi:hypothetical protein